MKLKRRRRRRSRRRNQIAYQLECNTTSFDAANFNVKKDTGTL